MRRLTLIYGRDDLLMRRLAKAKWPDVSWCNVNKLPLPPFSPEAQKFLEDFDIKQQAEMWEMMGSGASKLVKMWAWIRAQPTGTVPAIAYPEAGLNPGIHTGLFMFLLQTGPWLIISHSELFVLRAARLVRNGDFRSQYFDFYVLTKETGDALSAMDAAVNDIPSYTNIHLTEDGDFDRSWPDGFLDERRKELF